MASHDPFVLVKHADHLKTSDVEPTQVPLSAFEELWEDKGFVLVNSDSDTVKNVDDARVDQQDRLAEAKRASRRSSRSQTPSESKPSTSSKEG